MITRGHFTVEPPSSTGNTNVGHIREAPSAMQHQYLGGFPNGNKFNLYRCATEADGSCFFHAVCSALNIKDWHGGQRSNGDRVTIGHELRNVVNEVLNNESWTSFWKEKLAADGLAHRMHEVPSAASISKRLANIAEWSDVWLISWAMRQLDISCVFFDQVTDYKMYCGVRGEARAGTHIMICWVDHVHFEPVFLHNKHTGKMQTSFAHNDPFVKHVINMYENEQCPGAKIAI